MANHCDNVTTISKKGFDFNSVVERISTDGFFEQFFPVPAHLIKANAEQKTHESWNNITNFRFKFWGTAREADVQNTDVNNEGDMLTISYITAWVPPRQLMTALVGMGFSVSGAFWEPGMRIGGFYQTVNGMLEWYEEDNVEQTSELYAVLKTYDLDFYEEDEDVEY